MEVEDNDITTSLDVNLQGIDGRHTKLISIRERTDSKWVKYYVCVPEGEYSVVFDAIKGSSKYPIIMLDAIDMSARVEKPPAHERVVLYDELDVANYSTTYDSDADDTILAVKKCDIYVAGK